MTGKGNDGTGNIAERDEWQTKKELFDLLDSQYNFSFDCCAQPTNAKCKLWSGQFTLHQKEHLKTYTCWMNPPFTKAKEMFKHFFNVVERGVAIFRCDNLETKVWQEIILKNATWIFIPKGRISYTSFETGDMRNGKGSRFPSALIGFNVKPPKNLKGIILKINKEAGDLE